MALPGKFLKIPERRVKARKQGHLTIGAAFIFVAISMAKG